MYGHVETMAGAIAEGARSVDGVEVTLKRVPETMPEDIARQYGAKLDQSAPVASPKELGDYDAIIFGSPTRFGNMTAQMKQLFDSAGSVWLKGEMEGKPAGVFTSTASTHGGQETTLLSMMIPLIHLGAIIVGVPYSYEGMIHTDARGGTPYGASTIAGPQGELKPHVADFKLARMQGHRVAMITSKLRG